MAPMRPARWHRRCGRRSGAGRETVLPARRIPGAFRVAAGRAKGRSRFGGDPYGIYGGRSLHTRSHGEAFLAILKHRIRSGLFLFDEPESALSPHASLPFSPTWRQQVSTGKAQFIVATHSPVLLTFPGARILSFDGDAVRPIAIEETSHYQITRGILQNPAVYWKHLQPADVKDAKPARSKSRLAGKRRG